MMNVKTIGVSVGASDGHLAQLNLALKYAEESGFDLVEIGVSDLNLIISGRLMPDLSQNVRDVLGRYDLRYTLHAPNRTNLAFGYDRDLDYGVLQACIEFCHQIGADVLVYHSGLQAVEYPRYGYYPLPSPD